MSSVRFGSARWSSKSLTIARLYCRTASDSGVPTLAPRTFGSAPRVSSSCIISSCCVLLAPSRMASSNGEMPFWLTMFGSAPLSRSRWMASASRNLAANVRAVSPESARSFTRAPAARSCRMMSKRCFFSNIVAAAISGVIRSTAFGSAP